MNTCDTCCHWEESDSLKSVLGRKTCSNLKVTGYDPGYSGTQDGAHLIGRALRTGPKFGCIHHEAAPADDNIKAAMVVPVHFTTDRKAERAACGIIQLGRRVTKLIREVTCGACLRVAREGNLP